MADVVSRKRTPKRPKGEIGPGVEHKFLSRREIKMIDEALARARPDGEVILTIQKGRLRFISVTEDRSPDD